MNIYWKKEMRMCLWTKVQEIFAQEITKIDDTFFIRLNESKLHMEDKSVKEKYPLFIEKDYNDIDYYKQYPTIYHLRKELIENDSTHYGNKK